MKTFKTIEQLNATGSFVIEHTRDLKTVITSSTKFFIEGVKSTQAQLNENNLYQVIFNSVCKDGKLPNAICVGKSPLLESFIKVAPVVEEQHQIEEKTKSPVCFESLRVNQLFTLENNNRVYRKTGTHTYANINEKSISNKMVVTASPEKQVFVYESSDESLTPEQIQRLASSIPKGLSRDELMEEIGSILEDIAGLETASSATVKKVANAIAKAYRSNKSSVNEGMDDYTSDLQPEESYEEDNDDTKKWISNFNHVFSKSREGRNTITTTSNEEAQALTDILNHFDADSLVNLRAIIKSHNM